MRSSLDKGTTFPELSWDSLCGRKTREFAMEAPDSDAIRP